MQTLVLQNLQSFGNPVGGLYSGRFAMSIIKKHFVYERLWVLDRQCKDGIPASGSQDILL